MSQLVRSPHASSLYSTRVLLARAACTTNDEKLVRSPHASSFYSSHVALVRTTETMCMPPPRTPRTMVRIETAGQTYKQVQSFTYLGGAVTETPDMSVEIARRTRACWMRIRRYSRELYGQPKVALSLKTRMVKAEAIEALLYGCST